MAAPWQKSVVSWTANNALYRLEKVRAWDIRPTPTRYQPLDTVKKNSYAASGWSDELLRRVVQYYSRLRWYEHIPFKDFDRATFQRQKAEVLV